MHGTKFTTGLNLRLLVNYTLENSPRNVYLTGELFDIRVDEGTLIDRCIIGSVDEFWLVKLAFEIYTSTACSVDPINYLFRGLVNCLIKEAFT